MDIRLTFDASERPTLGQTFRIMLAAAREDLKRDPWYIRFATDGEDERRRYHEFYFN